MTLPQTVPEVITALGGIIAKAEAENSRLGLFPALYRKVTVRVLEGIASGRFENGDRMARLDVVFANRYLAAYEAYRAGQPCSACWAVAFDATRRWRPTILQHLLLGMAAHIQLDLGIAAATVAPGAALADLKRDFMGINAILGDLVAEVEGELDQLSPWLAAADLAAGDLDEAMARFGLGAVRDGAWQFAQALANLPQDQWQARVRDADESVAALSRLIANPGPMLSMMLFMVRLAERKPPAQAIQVLCEGMGTYPLESRSSQAPQG
jgi:hypothetical protein